MKRKAVIALSGGMDSTTLLYHALNEGFELEAVSFYYGQNHSKEIELAAEHCKTNNIPHRLIDISFLGEIAAKTSSLVQGAEAIPEGNYADENMKSTVVPFRNGIILSILAAIAEAEKCNYILYGAHAGDHAIYPDCRPEFEQAMAQAIKYGTYEEATMSAPFVHLNKISILERGIKLGVDYSKTWTCYKGGEEPCGKCGSCVERTEAFLENNLRDPLYLSDESWERAVDFYTKNI